MKHIHTNTADGSLQRRHSSACPQKTPTISHTWHMILMCCLLTAAFCPSAHAAQQEIKVLRIGSSSFPYTLIEYTRQVAEASGNFKIICDENADTTGYTRLDKLLSQPGLYKEWLNNKMPKIEEGNYDFVIIQTIGWPSQTPEEHTKLCTELLPDLVGRIKKTGAEVILYDKYIPVQSEEKDQRAQTWCSRYPDGYRLNYLLHIWAAKEAGIYGASFGGKTVTELWDQQPWEDMGILYCDPSHPGPVATLISGINLAYLLTGEDPSDTPLRSIKLSEGRLLGFNKLKDADKERGAATYEANKDRVQDGVLTLSDSEMKGLIDAAMMNHKHWQGRLTEAVSSDSAFAKVMSEIHAIHADMCNYQKYGVSEATMKNLEAKFAKPEDGDVINDRDLGIMMKKIKSLDYKSSEIRSGLKKHFDGSEAKALKSAFEKYWDENNNKLRDDVMLEGRLQQTRMVKEGNREEAHRIADTLGIIDMSLSFPGWKLFLGALPEEKKKEYLEKYQITGAAKRNLPIFGAYQNKYHDDEAKLYEGWDTWLKVWEDDDLMDELKTSNFDIAVIHKAEKEFQERIGE